MTENAGFQVKARDHAGTVHDEHWTTSRETAGQIVTDLIADPLVAAAWIDEDTPAGRHGPECEDEAPLVAADDSTGTEG